MVQAACELGGHDRKDDWLKTNKQGSEKSWRQGTGGRQRVMVLVMMARVHFFVETVVTAVEERTSVRGP